MGYKMSDVLVLNKAWAPVDTVSVFDAIVKLYQDKAYALDASCRMYKWESWIKDWSEAAALAQDVIHTSSVEIPIPRVIVLRDYTGFINRQPKCNRKNLFLRDKGQCQYCGYKGAYEKFNIEHVIPSSMGGKLEWTNVALACVPCNQKKRNRTPEQAGMKLIRKPFKPRWFQIKSDEKVRDKFNSWHELLSDMYWSVELKD